VHAPEYVEAVRTGDPRALAQSQGFHWSPEFAATVAESLAGRTDIEWYRCEADLRCV